MQVTQKIIPSDADQYHDLCDWIVAHCDRTSRVLDIGAGDGDAEYPQRIKPFIGTLVGVDPDPAVQFNEYLDKAEHATIEEFAAESPERFDVAIAVYVVEHVRDSKAFLDAIYKCLKPGGSFFAVTPNLWHYFGLSARATSMVGIEELLLHKLRGAQLTDSYHFPVRYRMNSVGALRKAAEAAGFRALEVHHLDDPGVFECYLPQRLKRVSSIYSSAVYKIGRPAVFGTLIFRLIA